jgi:hypothetical protein
MTLSLRRTALVACLLAVAVLPVLAQDAGEAPRLARLLLDNQPPPPQGEFVPVDELPVEEQIPAATLLISAYVFVVVMLFAYLISVGRRLGVVQQEVVRLENDLKKGRRG